MSDDDVPAVLELLHRNALGRAAGLLDHRADVEAPDWAAVTKVHFTVERRKVHSVEAFATLGEEQHDTAMNFIGELEKLVAPPQVATFAAVRRNETVYSRNPDVQGPMSAFGFSYLDDRYGAEQAAKLGLADHADNGEQYVYEALNFVDGRRTVSDIRDWLVTELGPVPLELVEEYLAALESIDVIRKVAP